MSTGGGKSLPCSNNKSDGEPPQEGERCDEAAARLLPSPLGGGVGGGVLVNMLHVIEHEFDNAK
jgi:hypothetical protein